MVVFDEKQWGDHQMHLKNRDDSQHQIGESGCTRLVSLRRTRPFFILWAWSGAKWHDPPAPVYWTAGVFFLADFVGRGFWRFADLCSEQPTSESSEFYVVSRVQDALADGQNRSIPCRDLHWGCLAKHGFMRYNWYVAGTHLYYTHLLCFSFYRGGLDGTATLLCTNSNLQAHIGVESLLRGVFVASLWGGTGGHFGLLAGWLPMAPSVCSGWKLVFCLGGPASPLCFASVRFGLWFQSLGT